MLSALLLAATATPSAQTVAVPRDALPVLGLHLMGPSRAEVPRLAEFIKKSLASEGVNTLVLEFNFNFEFKKRPEMAESGALTREHIQQIVAACKEAKIRLIPEINLLGHQSWAKNNGQLLKAHPDFDETPGKFPENKGIYCRSYCPRHPKVHDVVFDCIEELAAACETDAFHVGMDEVFTIGDPDCPRCKGTPTGVLYAEEVTRLHEFLKSKKLEMWMWGDRFIDGKSSNMGEWEAATNGTHEALKSLPKDVVICDWHYEKAEPSAILFAMNGNRVLSCPWNRTEVAIGQVELIRTLRKSSNKTLGDRFVGVMATSWGPVGGFMNAYERAEANPVADGEIKCFKEAMKAARASSAVSL